MSHYSANSIRDNISIATNEDLFPQPPTENEEEEGEVASIVEVQLQEVHSNDNTGVAAQAIADVLQQHIKGENKDLICNQIQSLCKFILELSNNTSHNPTDSKKIEFQATKIQEIKSENEQLKYKVNKLEKRLREWEDWRSDLYSSKKIKLQQQKVELKCNMDAAKRERDVILKLPDTATKYFELKSPSCQLFTNSLKELCSRKMRDRVSWLDDSVINTFFVILTQEICQVYGMGYTITLNSHYSKHFLDLPEGEKDEDLTPRLARAGYSFKNTKYFIFPIYLHGTEHWVLVWVDLDARSVIVYNTLKSIQFDYSALGNNILFAIEAYQQARQNQEQLNTDDWNISLNTDYQQRGSASCGVHVCILAKMIAFGEDLKVWGSDDYAVNGYRDFILGVFMSYCIKV